MIISDRDILDAVVRWSGGGLDKLAGRKISLRVKLVRANLYSYWIS